MNSSRPPRSRALHGRSPATSAPTQEAAAAPARRALGFRAAEVAVAARDFYLESWGLVALLSLIVQQVLGVSWLTVPAMGVLFAVGGSWVANSLDRERRHYRFAVRASLGRLLLPFWAFGLAAVPTMWWLGWSPATAAEGAAEAGAGALPGPWSLLLWLLPLATPPASELGAAWVLPLWSVATSLWLVALSPALVWLFRRWPRSTMAAVAAVVVLESADLLSLAEPAASTVLLVCTWAGCWMLGVAHRDGTIRRARLWLVAVTSAACLGLGLGLARQSPGEQLGADPAGMPLATMLVGLGATALLVLGHRAGASRVMRLRVVDRVVAVASRRFVTVFLWTNALVAAAWALSEWSPAAPVFWDHRIGPAVPVALTALLFLAAVVVAVGWLEDVAARRPVEVLPGVPVNRRRLDSPGAARPRRQKPRRAV